MKSFSKIICVFIFTLYFHNFSSAKIQPSGGIILNFTQVMFEYNEVPGATRYVISIWSVESENKKEIKVNNTSLAFIASFFEFGKNYQWHYEAYTKNKSIFKSEDFNFSIGQYSLVDTALYHQKIDILKNGAFDDDIIFLDYLGIAINRQGKPVWYYSFLPHNEKTFPDFRNMRMTRNGTISFQDNSDCYETDVTGRIVWKAPNDGKISGEKTEFYHHDFRKLDDGTYLTSSYQFVTEPNYHNPAVNCKVRYNTLIQYDAEGNILWHWNEKDHIDQDFFFRDLSGDWTEYPGTHLNGFDYDGKENTVVMSFRDNSDIIKIDKETGEIIYDLSIYSSRSKKQGKKPWFSRQHGPVILPNNEILIYNNNVPDDSTKEITYPQVLIIKEPVKDAPALKIWEYECKSDRFPNGIIGKEGYAVPLPNKNILVCMGSANYIFEITRDKKIVWQCSFEKFDDKENKWTPFSNYRCNFSSSLYPFYFTLQHVNEKHSTTNFKINNEGTEDDRYKIEAILQNGFKKIFTDTITIKKSSSQTISIPRDSKITNGNIVVFVTSFSNNAESKYLEFKN